MIERNNPPTITTVQLNSGGGLVSEGLTMGTLIEFYHLDVAVPDDGMCASACFLPFAAGVHKTVGNGARIGIHSATSHPGSDDDGTGTMLMARFASSVGVPPAILGQMVVTENRHMTWLTPADLRSMGAAVVPAELPLHVAPAPTIEAAHNEKASQRLPSTTSMTTATWIFGGGILSDRPEKTLDAYRFQSTT